MKKSSLFLTIVSSFIIVLIVPLNGYTQATFNPATITDSSFKVFLPKWERYVDSTASGNSTLMKENASHSNDITIMGAFGGYEMNTKQI